ncbi:MAG: gluconate 2-dehydrogenase subunit 3 family protein [Flavobacteriaceae bacterium]|nr:gluconate 2-dehydrogenase subunit 3 family protein [Flavobacteriaceae bacterium]
MNRRQALRNIGLSTGFMVATPSLLTLLQSCTTEKEHWQPTFLSVDQGIFLNRVVDIILPKTEDSPSASEVNVPEFIDKYMADILMEEEQQKQTKALDNLISKIKADYGESLDDISDEEYKKILDKYLLGRGESDPQREANPNNSDYTEYEVMSGIKGMVINAYRMSEQVGENVLVYDPVPAQYYCGDLQELTGGKAYSL